jgi:hypothetical protein
MAWLTPDEIPEGDDCRPLFIPDSSDWLAIVSGAILPLTREWNWEQFGTLTPAECAQRMQVMMEQYYDEDCGGCELPSGGKVIRIGEGGFFEELCGDAWCPPTGDYAVPPVPARGEPTPEENICLAAKNAAAVLAEVYETMLDDYENDIDWQIAMTGFVAQVAASILPAIALLSASFLGIAAGIFGAFYTAMEFLTEDVWDSEFTAKLVCILQYCASESAGVVTFDYDCFMHELQFHTDVSDPSFGEIRLLGQIWYIMQFIGIDGLNLAGATTAITDPTCDGCDYWCQMFDYTTTPSLEDWTQYLKGDWTGTEWQGVNSTVGSSGGQYNLSAGVQWDWATPTEITRIEVNTTMAKGSSGIGCDVTIRDLDSGTVIFASSLNACGTNAVFVWTGTRTVEHLAIWVNGGRSVAPGTGSAGATALLHALRIEGRGDNPFAESSNC